MKILIVQSGGYAGVPIELAKVDTSALPEEQAQRIEQLVHDAPSFKPSYQPQNQPVSETIGADIGVTYTITVEDAGQERIASFVETGSGIVGSVNEELRPLVTALTKGSLP